MKYVINTKQVFIWHLSCSVTTTFIIQLLYSTNQALNLALTSGGRTPSLFQTFLHYSETSKGACRNVVTFCEIHLATFM